MRRRLGRGLLLALTYLAFGQAAVTYKVKLTTSEGGSIISLSSEQYVAGVLAGECSNFTSDEALKAMSIVIRTYAAYTRSRHAHEGYDFCATTHCQRFIKDAATARLREIVDKTAGEMLWYEGRPAFAAYAQDCGGMTENVSAVWTELQAPYLGVKSDPYCRRNGGAPWTWRATGQEIAAVLADAGLAYPQSLSRIEVIRQSQSHRAQLLSLNGADTSVTVNASTLRFAVGRKLGWNLLRSERYQIDSSSRQIIFRGDGRGHGVGLCQKGADEMGREGFSEQAILAFYYPGTKISRLGTGLAWKRLGGEKITLYTVTPAADRKLLLLAEEQRRKVSARLHRSFDAIIDLYVYPDVATFRDGTGEPGWVAAHATGARIDLQPVAMLDQKGVLTQTLYHEIAHTIIETTAVPGLPLWFREGLATWLAQPAAPGLNLESSIADTNLRARTQPADARRAYDEAAVRVGALVSRYGEATVVSWLGSGLPPAVTNASNKNAETKSR